MTPQKHRDEIDQLDYIADQFPLGTCIKSDHPHDPIFGRVIGWRLAGNLVCVDAVCVPGNWPMHLLPSRIKLISPSEMPDYTRKLW